MRLSIRTWWIHCELFLSHLQTDENLIRGDLKISNSENARPEMDADARGPMGLDQLLTNMDRLRVGRGDGESWPMKLFKRLLR